ncbi:MAG: MCE family protein [Gammaproteobacteria bacterium]|nr:MCE family protein [Gammaproteobacteria bacterium]
MKQDNINYVVVGSFVVVVLATFLVLLGVLTGRAGSTDSYYAIFNNVTGLDLGTAVTYEGYQVGQVEDINVLQKDGVTRYRVEFGIQEGWKVPADSTAYIQTAGLLAAVTIDIKEGKSKIYHQPGAELIGVVGEDMLATMATAAADSGELLVSLQKSAKGLEQLLTGPTGKKMGSVINQFDIALVKANKLLENTNDFIQHNRGDLDQAITDLRVTMGVMAKHIDGIAFNLEEASRNLHELTRQVRAKPSLLIHGGSQNKGASVENVE